MTQFELSDPLVTGRNSARFVSHFKCNVSSLEFMASLVRAKRQHACDLRLKQDFVIAVIEISHKLPEKECVCVCVGGCVCVCARARARVYLYARISFVRLSHNLLSAFEGAM